MFGTSNLRLLIGLALQIALTLENYVVMHEAQRRTKEYELLTEIGQAISSHLNQDEVLRTVQVELGQIFDTSKFYIAFQEEDEIRFELEIEGGRDSSQALAQGRQWIYRAHSPNRAAAADRVRSGTSAREDSGWISFRRVRHARFCAVPIFLGGKAGGRDGGAEHANVNRSSRRGTSR